MTRGANERTRARSTVPPVAWLLGLSIVLALVMALCNQAPTAEDRRQAQIIADEADAEAAVKARLRAPQSATFSREQDLVGGSGARLVCGYVNAKNGFGGLNGDEKFVWLSDDGLQHAAATEEDQPTIVALFWAKGCKD